jgi:hypothetical protein
VFSEQNILKYQIFLTPHWDGMGHEEPSKLLCKRVWIGFSAVASGQANRPWSSHLVIFLIVVRTAHFSWVILEGKGHQSTLPLPAFSR